MKRIIRRMSDTLPVKPASAMREAWREGYGWRDLRRDVMAGLVVGVIALPLSMALAIASGVPPQFGLYTAIVGGAVIALLGGSRVQVSGPTAAFVVILAPIAAKFGPGGLMLAGLMAGVMLVLMGLFRFGRLIQFIPYPVTTGFTAGIAIVIATLQVKDLLGLRVPHMPEHYTERVAALVKALPTARWEDVLIGSLTLAVLVFWPRFSKRVPAALVALTAAALLAWAASLLLDGFEVATIGSRFSYESGGVTRQGIPQVPPMPAWPWSWGGPGGTPLQLSWGLFRDLVPSALAIAMLGAIESLLSAVVADGMTGMKHDPDGELVAQGIGNIVAPLFGGIAATGALARTAANVRSGGRSPVASFTHSVFLLLSVVALAPLLAWLPMASMAALLLIVAMDMSEARHFVYTLRVAPRSDVLVLVLCFALTIIFDMVVAVSVGVVLAAMLFMRSMAEVADVRLVSEEHHAFAGPMPPGVVVYEIAGPMFFGAAHKAMSALRSLDAGVCAVVLDMRSVPVMDTTGLVNLESAVDRLAPWGVQVILAGVRHQPMRLLAKAHMHRGRRNMNVRSSFDDAMALAAAVAAIAGPGGATPSRT